MSTTTFLRMASMGRCAFAGFLATRCHRSPCRGSAATHRRTTWRNSHKDIHRRMVTPPPTAPASQEEQNNYSECIETASTAVLWNRTDAQPTGRGQPGTVHASSSFKNFGRFRPIWCRQSCWLQMLTNKKSSSGKTCSTAGAPTSSCPTN
jgi:hypothetical protein